MIVFLVEYNSSDNYKKENLEKIFGKGIRIFFEEKEDIIDKKFSKEKNILEKIAEESIEIDYYGIQTKTFLEEISKGKYKKLFREMRHFLYPYYDWLK